MDNFDRPATHEETFSELGILQSYGGAARKPLVLYDLFNYLCKQDKFDKRQIREMVDVYCALCNEYYILNLNKKEPKTEFYMSDARWEKYYFAQKARENAIKRLQKYSLIFVTKKANPTKRVNKVLMYQINFGLLHALREVCEQVRPKSRKSKKQDFYVALARYLKENEE